ncbi:flagellar hook-associated protein FlgK [Actinoplanes sp. NPDC049548]|uniref:flagellar hook-associated protein FlgK n=1 Tax=Actinoplanes sp. NPDC049548 TaxID=3155152 RepID=UPI0034256FC1
MPSSFGGINTALTSLYAQRRGLDVTGQNIANANTEGYTRQRVNMNSQVGSLSAAMYARTDGLGTGVAVTDVQRLRDEYLENRGRSEHANDSYLKAQSAAYVAIEDTFAEPGDTALAAQFRDMWGNWNDVSNNPQLAAPRSALIQQSSTVADQLNASHQALARQWKINESQMTAYVDEINGTAKSIAQLNDSIIKANASGLTVNELEDQRDVLAMRLAELTGASAAKRPNGGMDVFITGQNLVTGTNVREVEFVGAERLEDQAGNPVQLQWVDIDEPIKAGGKVGAAMDVMTNIIPDLSADIDSVAKNLIDSVNAKHRLGYSVDGTTGQDFFSGTTAADIKVLVKDPDKVAISATAGTLDNSVADSIADIGDDPDGPDREYSGVIGKLGVDSQGTARRAEIQSVVTEQVDAAREGEAGVNLDEEMTNLLTYQRGYEAASRVLTTIDSMLDQLINRTGLVGR